MSTDPTTLPALPADVAERLRAAESEVEQQPAALPVLFPGAARRIGRGPGPDGRPVEDAVRVRLLRAAARSLDNAGAVAALARDLYDHGDADERRAVLLALPWLAVSDRALPLVRDALRTNDTRLVAAAMGPYAAEHLPPAEWRHGVLKCLFTGVPVSAVHALHERRDDELDRMVRAWADERTAAGRDLPEDLRALLALQR